MQWKSEQSFDVGLPLPNETTPELLRVIRGLETLAGACSNERSLSLSQGREHGREMAGLMLRAALAPDRLFSDKNFPSIPFRACLGLLRARCVIHKLPRVSHSPVHSGSLWRTHLGARSHELYQKNFLTYTPSSVESFRPAGKLGRPRDYAPRAKYKSVSDESPPSSLMSRAR